MALVDVNTSIFTIKAPAGTEIISISDVSISFTEMKSLREYSALLGEVVTLPMGLYDCSYETKAVLKDESSISEAVIYGKYPNLVVSNNMEPVSLETFLRPRNGDFVIEEIFCSSTANAKGTAYQFDTYMKVYNNSDVVLFADRMALVESQFIASTYFDYTPDMRDSRVAIKAFYVVPGSGTDYPINPGESFIICSQAQNHSLINEGSVDTSIADFEVYDESTVPTQMDVDNESVPNMERWYSDTKTIWGFSMQGNRSIAIARVPQNVSMDDFVEMGTYSYSYVNQGKTMTRSAYWIPNEWVIDGVNMCPVDMWKWNIFLPNIDAGYTYSNETNANKAQLGLSVVRKTASTTEDGIRKLQDTNDSSVDFLTAQTPTLLNK